MAHDTIAILDYGSQTAQLTRDMCVSCTSTAS